MRTVRWHGLALMAILGAVESREAGAQLAGLLEDILPIQQAGASYPNFLGSAGEFTYFSASLPTSGRDLWRTDGTPEGTSLAHKTCSDYCNDYLRSLDLSTNGQKLFLARVHPTDNTSADALFLARATAPEVVEILGAGAGLTFPNVAAPGGSAYLDERLYFWGTANGNDRLLRTSASGAEAELIRDMSEFDGLSGFQSLASTVLFWAHPDSGPIELWKTDGTASGTTRIVALDVTPGDQVVALAGRLMIFTATGESGLEVWSTDGTAAHTQPLTDFADSGAFVWEMMASSTHVFLFVHDLSFGQELWATDGTATGTNQVTSFGYFQPFAPGSPFHHLAVAGSTAYFLATDGLGGAGLWSASAAPFSASPILEICPEAYCLETAWLERIDSRLFFLREDAELGREIWTSDGTAAGSRILEDACPGLCSGGGTILASNEHRLVYAAMASEVFRPEAFVAELPWTGAISLFDELRGAPVLDLVYVGDTVLNGPRIYFPAKGRPGDLEPWVSEGTAPTSLQLADIAGPTYGSSSAHGFESMGSSVAFLATDPEFETRMWLTEGTTASTRPVPWNVELCSRPEAKIHALDGKFLHLSCHGILKSVDPGTSLATEVILGIPGDFCTSLDSEIADGSLAVLLGCDSSKKIWRSDGTAAGTSLAFSFPADFFVGPLEPVAGKTLFAGGFLPNLRLYAISADLSGYVPLTPAGVAPDGELAPSQQAIGFFTHADRLWRTDGTPAGTFELNTPSREFVILQAATRSPSGFDLLLATGSSTEEIWSTDSEAFAIQTRASIANYAPPSRDLPLVRAGSRLYAVLPSSIDGPGLWMLEDGSSELRRLHSASSIGLSSFDSDNYGLAGSATSVYFTACDPSHGCEIWTSDGTEVGTVLLQDISPGSESSNPQSFFTSDTELYFLADDNLHSSEVWVLPLNGGPACRADERRLCLESGRFQVSSTWRDFSGRFGDATAVPITGDTGYFWFFAEDNVELILKLIDGEGYNGHHWVYYGALSNVEYTFTVTDSETGAAKRYFNPATRFASSGDITAFGPQGAHAQGGPAGAMTRAATPPEISLATFSAPLELPGACVPTATRFCILDNRFAVTATWRDFAGHTGTANAGTLTDDTGYLWFFDDANVEVVLKMVDAGAFNGHFWVYYGALSNVEYTLTVTDTVAGGSPRIYRNALGQFGSFGDIEAFPAP